MQQTPTCSWMISVPKAHPRSRRSIDTPKGGFGGFQHLEGKRRGGGVGLHSFKSGPHLSFSNVLAKLVTDTTSHPFLPLVQETKRLLTPTNIPTDFSSSSEFGVSSHKSYSFLDVIVVHFHFYSLIPPPPPPPPPSRPSLLLSPSTHNSSSDTQLNMSLPPSDITASTINTILERYPGTILASERPPSSGSSSSSSSKVKTTGNAEKDEHEQNGKNGKGKQETDTLRSLDSWRLHELPGSVQERATAGGKKEIGKMSTGESGRGRGRGAYLTKEEVKKLIRWKL